MHSILYKFVISLGCCLVVPAAFAASSQPQSAHAAPTATSAHTTGPRLCFDQVFYKPLPGKANYCLGLKDWRNGHYRSGLELLKLAAGWGNKNAQYTLGLIYYNGHHVPAQPALGIAWLKLADQRHNDAEITKVTQSAIEWATPAQRKQSDQLFQQMRGKYGDAVATARAWEHLQHWKLGHDAIASGCVEVYGPYAYAARHAGLAAAGPVAMPPIVPAVTNALGVVLGSGKPVTPARLAAAAPEAHRLNRANQLKQRFNQAAREGQCIPLQMTRRMVQRSAHTYFRDWVGSVNVGPVETVPAPAASAGH